MSRSIRNDTSSLAFGIVGRFGGSSAGFVVAALNAASAASREEVGLRVLSTDILLPPCHLLRQLQLRARSRQGSMDRRSHAVGAELDSDSWRSKRLERAVAVGAGLKPTPGRGLTMGEYSGCLLSHVICA